LVVLLPLTVDVWRYPITQSVATRINGPDAARHPIERFPYRHKRYRAIAAGCDKTKRNALSHTYLAASAIPPN